MVYETRLMTKEEFGHVWKWAKEEGWNPGLSDVDAFYETDPTGFWVGVLDGEPIASLSVVKYGSDYAFVGYYLVKNGLRAQGYGYKLWQDALNSVADGVVLGLDGVVAQQENYKKSGFALCHKTMRHEGTAAPDLTMPPTVKDITAVSFDELVRYDSEFYPCERSVFLKSWANYPDGHALCVTHPDEPSKLIGYGVIRPSVIGYRIGPLLADSPAVAESLIVGLTSKLPAGTKYFMDIPEPNPLGSELAKKFDMVPCFETARMYKGKAPSTPHDRLYGLSSLELG
eukprot:TRINITY_DN2589_c0_g1_i6.p2 TRINITY_DN2589_c0_g1~~TRINITY_DN2589_c0_g1_i6.p2  ORF type:complete len:285 (+),score=58.80 TRINITY_DN2589_c0_g1_i6:50-904(+)